MTTHDFRTTYWGHNHDIELKGETGTYVGPVWSSTPIYQGDDILWKTNYGHAVMRVTAVRRENDPPDMCWVTCRVEKRVADPSIVSQEEIDEAFK